MEAGKCRSLEKVNMLVVRKKKEADANKEVGGGPRRNAELEKLQNYRH